ncbi:MAG TPA: hypothetical protein PLI09_12140 [Candidatus Hydrogenedentes bacterium]|nr:hypothetical protein [Candidatus Hydrogenedentota bacterium]
MHSDPILREVHRMKDESAREMDYNIHKIFRRMRENEKKHPGRMAAITPQPVLQAKPGTVPRKAAK